MRGPNIQMAFVIARLKTDGDTSPTEWKQQKPGDSCLSWNKPDLIWWGLLPHCHCTHYSKESKASLQSSRNYSIILLWEVRWSNKLSLVSTAPVDYGGTEG